MPRKTISPEKLAEFMEDVSLLIGDAQSVEDCLQSDFTSPMGPLLEHARTANAAIRVLSGIQLGLLARLALEDLRRETRQSLGA